MIVELYSKANKHPDQKMLMDNTNSNLINSKFAVSAQPPEIFHETTILQISLRSLPRANTMFPLPVAWPMVMAAKSKELFLSTRFLKRLRLVLMICWKDVFNWRQNADNLIGLYQAIRLCSVHIPPGFSISFKAFKKGQADLFSIGGYCGRVILN